MPTFEISLPGSDETYEIDAPEGTSAAQAAKQLREHLTAQRAEEPWYEDFAEGVGLSGMETYYGIKSLFGDLDKEEQARLEDWRQDAGQSGWGTAGQVVGEIGQLAIPGGALTKGLRAASKASQASRGGRALTRALGDTGAAVGLAAAQAPDIGETRQGQAETALQGALTGEALGYGLSKAARGINRSRAGQAMIDAGLSPTPGQASQNFSIKGVEDVFGVLPVTGPTVRKARERVDKELGEKIMQEAVAPGKTVNKIGTDGVQQLKQGFEEAYSEAWSGATSVSDQAKKAFVYTASNAMDRLTKKQKRALSSLIDDFKSLTSNATPDKFKALDNDLRRRIAASKKDYDYQQLLIELREKLRSGAPEGVMEKLSAIDAKYGNYLVVRQAAKNAADEYGEFTGKQLLSAVKTVGKSAAGEGTAPLQALGTAAANAEKRGVLPAPLDFIRSISAIGPAIPGAKYGGRAVLGQTAPQRGLAKALGAVPEYLKRPGLAGAVYAREEEE